MGQAKHALKSGVGLSPITWAGAIGHEAQTHFIWVGIKPYPTHFVGLENDLTDRFKKVDGFSPTIRVGLKSYSQNLVTDLT